MNELQDAHKRRMARMPWLYFRAKPAIRAWAEPWQAELLARLHRTEDVALDPSCFLAPDADLIAEPGRRIEAGPRCAFAAGVFVHGPVTLGADVSVNPHVTLEGGTAGIEVGDGTRIATGARLFAFDHGMDPDRPIRDQPTRSRGIRIGADVWIGANAGITDGVTVGDHAVVAMGAVVTHDVPAWAVVGGVPARVLGDRRSRS